MAHIERFRRSSLPPQPRLLSAQGRTGTIITMKTNMVRGADALKIARDVLHLNDFRPGQSEALDAVLQGTNALVVMPTGSGKSAIYQIAGMLIEGFTVVVSPLIARQYAHVELINSMGVDIAAQLNSTLTDAERDEVFTRLRAGEIRFLFLAPEQFRSDDTMACLTKVPPSLFVVDEAHCISEWGHDFRPDYLRLGTVVGQLGHPQTLALTATAAPPVRLEIIERLGMGEPATIIQGFDRPHLHLAVETFEDEETKRATLLDRVEASLKPGIIYAATRKDTEELASALNARGVSSAAYHAGLKADARTGVQAAFMDDIVDVIVATIAFGMGIDKPNVRFVFHHNISESIDSYYQEIGRAGRDGKDADAVLFYLPKDLDLRRFQSGAGELTVDEVALIVEDMMNDDGPVHPDELKEAARLAGLSDSRLMRIVGRLEDADIVEVDAIGDITMKMSEVDSRDTGRAAVEAQKNLQRFAHSRIEMIRQYAELGQCRREFLLNYFGEQFAAPCETCDNCDAGLVAATAHVERPFPLNMPVMHAKWGMGEVMRYERDTMVVLFETVGYRTLGIELVLANGLLEARGDIVLDAAD